MTDVIVFDVENLPNCCHSWFYILYYIYIYMFILLLLHPHDYPIKSSYIYTCMYIYIYIYAIIENISWKTSQYSHMKSHETYGETRVTPPHVAEHSDFFPVSVWSLRVWQWVPVASPGRSAVFLSKKFVGILALLNSDVPSGKHTKSYWKLPFIADLPS